MVEQIISERPMCLADVKEELSKIKKRDKDLGVRAGKTMDYLATATTLSPKEAADIRKELVKLDIPRLKEIQIEKIIDIMPTNGEDLKVILQGYTITLSKDNITKILDIVKKYSG